MTIVTLSERMALKCSGVDGLKQSWVFFSYLHELHSLWQFGSHLEGAEYEVGNGFFRCSEWGKVKLLDYDAIPCYLRVGS